MVDISIVLELSSDSAKGVACKVNKQHCQLSFVNCCFFLFVEHAQIHIKTHYLNRLAAM